MSNLMSNNTKEKRMVSSLYEHRKNLKNNNTDRYTRDKKRAIETFANVAYRNYENCGRNKKHVMSLLRQLGELVFNAQKSLPLYEFNFGDPERLPRAWNSPMKKGWNLNYIKWEIGHLKSKNKGGIDLDKPENLSFQSARCNQHVQSGLDYYETTEYKFVPEIRERVNAIFAVHKTPEWNRISNEIAQLTKTCKRI